MERTPHKCFRCGSEDHYIEECPNPSKDNRKWRNKVRFSEIGNHTSQNENNNDEDNNNQKIYGYMAHMFDNDECPTRNLVTVCN